MLLLLTRPVSQEREQADFKAEARRRELEFHQAQEAKVLEATARLREIEQRIQQEDAKRDELVAKKAEIARAERERTDRLRRAEIAARMVAEEKRKLAEKEAWLVDQAIAMEREAQEAQEAVRNVEREADMLGLDLNQASISREGGYANEFAQPRSGGDSAYDRKTLAVRRTAPSYFDASGNTR